MGTMLAFAPMAIAIAAAIGFYLALCLDRPKRAFALAVLCSVAALAPLLLPQEAIMIRFGLALFSAFMVLKMWDLHIGAIHGQRPRSIEFLGFLANLYFFVFRKRGVESQPSTSRNCLELALGIAGFCAAFGVLFLKGKIDWLAFPFLFEHAVIAIAFYVLLIAELTAVVAITRLVGAYIINANDGPFAARTPADFWRRYNRLIGQFLYEDFFKPLRGRRHPVRATLGVFAVSGILHEYFFWVALGQFVGWQLLFFMLQGGAVVLTLRVKPTGWKAFAWATGTLVFNIVSSVPFFASFNSVIPIYQNSLPAWLGCVACLKSPSLI